MQNKKDKALFNSFLNNNDIKFEKSKNSDNNKKYQLFQPN